MRKTIFLVFFILTSCVYEQPFNKYQWMEKNNLGYYSNREFMLSDVIDNVLFKGESYNNVICLLGENTLKRHNNELFIDYNITTEFGFGSIDPNYTKSLLIYFTSDSSLIRHEVFTWSR